MRTHERHCEFFVTPFRLTNAPSTFQALLNQVFKPHVRFVLIFFNKILIYSQTWSEHLRHVGDVLKILTENHLVAKHTKCHFGCRKVDYLGHVISEGGIVVYTKKVETIFGWLLPLHPKEMRGFGPHGVLPDIHPRLWGYSCPLNAMLKKGSFQWDEKARIAFKSSHSSHHPCWQGRDHGGC